MKKPFANIFSIPFPHRGKMEGGYIKKLFFLLLSSIIWQLSPAQQIKISALPTYTDTTVAGWIPIVQGSITKKIAATKLINGTQLITSVFGRTGAISAQGSDYSFYYPLTQRFLDSIAVLKALIGTGAWDTMGISHRIDAKQNLLPSGTNLQYWDATGALRTFSISVYQFGDTKYSLLTHTHNGLAPVGGLTGQILKKVGPDDYNYTWANDNVGIGIEDTAAILLNYLRDVGFALARSGHIIYFDSLSSAVGFHTQPYNDLRYYPLSANPGGYKTTFGTFQNVLDNGNTSITLAKYGGNYHAGFTDYTFIDKKYADSTREKSRDSVVALIGAGANTIYTANDNLTSDRSVGLNWHSLTFLGGISTGLSLSPIYGAVHLSALDSNYYAYGTGAFLFLTADKTHGGGVSFYLGAQRGYGSHASVSGDALADIIEIYGGNGSDSGSVVDVSKNGIVLNPYNRNLKIDTLSRSSSSSNTTMVWDSVTHKVAYQTISGSLGLTASNFVFEEIPSGTINGSNPTFSLANTPIIGTVKLYLNGVRLAVADSDYTITGATITMITIPQTGDFFISDYIK